MADIITAADLAAWLRDDSLADNASIAQIVELTNDLITEAWEDEETPVPVHVKMLALSVAARAWVNNPAQSNVESVSVRVDDAGTTRRYRSPSRLGVYLTADERATLNGEARTRSVRLIRYGEV